MTNKTFLLGVGAQKGGTTWLHEYLSSRPDADFGFSKEYHVLEHHLSPEWTKQKQERKRIRERMKSKKERTAAQDEKLTRLIKFEQFYADANYYFDYFATLLDRPGITLTGDITPAYSGLDADTFLRTREGFKHRGIRSVALFVMRDPVERIISQFRMSIRNGGKTYSAADEERFIAANYAKPPAQFRSRYDLTMARLDQAFAPTDIFTTFYEELFSPETVRGICDFLAIPFVAPDVDKIVNASRTENETSRKLRRKIANEYGEVYRDAIARYGRERISRIWGPSLALVDWS